MSIQSFHLSSTFKRAVNPDEGKIVFGMYNTCTLSGPDGYLNAADTTPNWTAIRGAYLDTTRMKVRRSFFSGMPTSFGQTTAAANVPAGITSALSVKPTGLDPANILNGSNDAAIQSLAASCPAGTYLICFHEPEGNMTGSTFVQMQQRFYSIAKAANPNITIGTVHAVFQWWPNSTIVPTPDDWYAGDNYCDFIAADTYVSDYKPRYSLRNHLGHQRWHNWAASKGKPLLVTEFSCDFDSQEAGYIGRYSDAERAAIIGDSLDWMQETGQYKMFLYWNGILSDEGVNNFQITPSTSNTTGSPLALATFNAKVAAYGATYTSQIKEVG